MIYLNLISFIGLLGVCAIAWLFSERRRRFPWQTVALGLLLQLILAFFVFQFPPTRRALEGFSTFLDSIFLAADTGARFVFGKNIVPVPGEPPPVDLGYIFAFRALPTVIFFSGLMALLYNLGIIQILTNIFAKLFYYTMRLSGAEALSGAANIFVGFDNGNPSILGTPEPEPTPQVSPAPSPVVSPTPVVAPTVAPSPSPTTSP
jgi:CNT family concentrative nucleoside transporter